MKLHEALTLALVSAMLTFMVGAVLLQAMAQK